MNDSQVAAIPHEDDRARREQLLALSRLPPGRKLQAVLEWSEMSRELFRCELRRLHPELPEADLNRLYLDRLGLCHNKHS